MAYNMRGFGGFKDSATKLKTNYKKGFEKMSNKELKGVVNRHKDRGTSRKTAFNSEKEAEISMDSLNTAQNTLRLRKLNKMDPSGRIRKSRLGPKKKSPLPADKKLIDIAAKMGKKGNDMLKKMFDIPAVRAYKQLKKTKDAYKKVKMKKNIKKTVKYPKIAKAIKKPVSSTDLYLEKLRKNLNITKKDKTRTLKPLNFQTTELGQMKASIRKRK